MKKGLLSVLISLIVANCFANPFYKIQIPEDTHWLSPDEIGIEIKNSNLKYKNGVYISDDQTFYSAHSKYFDIELHRDCDSQMKIYFVDKRDNDCKILEAFEIYYWYDDDKEYYTTMFSDLIFAFMKGPNYLIEQLDKIKGFEVNTLFYYKNSIYRVGHTNYSNTRGAIKLYYEK